MINKVSQLSDKIKSFLKPKKIFCYAPFIHTFITPDNDVYSCPECMVKNFSIIYLGNLKEASFKKIWDSSYTKSFKKNIKNRNLTNCQISTCANRTNFHMQVIINYLKKNSTKDIKGYPKIVTFGEDIKGFSNCISANNIEIDKNLTDKYFDVLKTAKEVVFSHKTDPFSNQETSSFIQNVAENFPDIKFNIVSNGILFNEENCIKLGIKDRINNVLIYVNAATKETYDTFVHNGDFDTLKQNLIYLGNLKKEGKLDNLFLAFVTDENNYREMPQFIDFTREVGGYALFWLKTKRKFNGMYTLDKNELINPINEHYADFIKVLNSTKFNTECSCLAYTLNIYIDKY